MKDVRKVAATVPEYVAALPPKTRRVVKQVLATIRKAAPGAEERISYQIPAFKLDAGYLIYVAAFDQHIGVYPAPDGDAAFNAAAKPYRSGKATLRFFLDEPVPLDLVRAAVKFRKLALLAHARAKKAPAK
jgi:uncharacterized protein YdhG (YjbR/CyaY superfamily)